MTFRELRYVTGDDQVQLAAAAGGLTRPGAARRGRNVIVHGGSGSR